jgi:flagellar biosynthesis protein FlhF
MRLKFLDADDEREAVFLAALARDPAGIRVGDDPEARFEVPSGAVGTAEIVEAVLQYHGAPPTLIRNVIARRQRRADPLRLLSTGLKASLTFTRLPVAAGCRLMLIGPPAAGKTTMMAKLAARGHAPPATVFTTDGDRPGGMEQLADPMNILGIGAERLDAAAETMPQSGRRSGALLVDTGGTDADAGFDSLGRLALTLGVEPVLVLPATIDADEAGKFALAARAIGATRLLITRLDLARRLGGPLTAAAAGLAITGGSVTPHFAYGLRHIGSGALAGHLFALARRRAPGER